MNKQQRHIEYQLVFVDDKHASDKRKPRMIHIVVVVVVVAAAAADVAMTAIMMSGIRRSFAAHCYENIKLWLTFRVVYRGPH